MLRIPRMLKTIIKRLILWFIPFIAGISVIFIDSRSEFVFTIMTILAIGYQIYLEAARID